MSNFINASQKKHVKVKNEQFFTNWRAKMPPLISEHNHFKQTSNNNDVHQKSIFSQNKKAKWSFWVVKALICRWFQLYSSAHPPFRHVKLSRSGFPNKGCRTGDLYRSPRTFSLLTCPAPLRTFSILHRNRCLLDLTPTVSDSQNEKFANFDSRVKDTLNLCETYQLFFVR